MFPIERQNFDGQIKVIAISENFLKIWPPARILVSPEILIFHNQNLQRAVNCQPSCRAGDCWVGYFHVHEATCWTLKLFARIWILHMFQSTTFNATTVLLLLRCIDGCILCNGYTHARNLYIKWFSDNENIILTRLKIYQNNFWTSF